VLIVDDSAVIRRLLTAVIDTDPAIDVVGVAHDGQMGLQRIDELQPDLVTLDVEMPIMDGITTLRHIRKRYPRLPVVMFARSPSGAHQRPSRRRASAPATT